MMQGPVSSLLTISGLRMTVASKKLAGGLGNTGSDVFPPSRAGNVRCSPFGHIFS